jgi:hypothetical protein
METKYFVISLPRTGTKSLCRMAHECGLKFKHAAVTTFEKSLRDGHNFFADTPCYVPSFVESICNREDIKPKFIFINKEYSSVFESWKKVNLYLNYTRMYNQWMDEDLKSKMTINSKTDFLSLHESFSETFMDESNFEKLFELHKEKVLSIVKQHKKDLLIYNFTEGWKPFCEFINCEIPDSNLPHLNTNTMFEPII